MKYHECCLFITCVTFLIYWYVIIDEVLKKDCRTFLCPAAFQYLSFYYPGAFNIPVQIPVLIWSHTKHFFKLYPKMALG